MWSRTVLPESERRFLTPFWSLPDNVTRWLLMTTLFNLHVCPKRDESRGEGHEH